MIAAGGVAFLAGAKPTAATAQHPPASTVKVEERELSAVVSQDGILTYRALPDGSPYSVINQAGGIYTKLPALGVVISLGQELYRVNDSPVVLLYGSTPAYRTLSVGATGADVAELNADLVALGYATSSQLSPTSESYGWSTVTALEKLQAALGVTQTGRLAPGQAVFEPTAVRVTTLSAQLGGITQIGQIVMRATSNARQVQMALSASQQTEMAIGDKVTITLPNDQTTPGVVSSVGTVATCPASSAGPGTGTCSSPTISVDITPSDPAATGTWDQAPVRVAITTASVPSALVVPVTALLARSAGGYAVEVVGSGGFSHFVPVSLGLFDDADGLVQVSGSGLAAGQEVVVPST
jgi:peptidoglycan hydrolase-like protein with peptidoglycan-binding domain